MLPYQKLVLLSVLLSSLTLVGCSGGGSTDDVARNNGSNSSSIVEGDSQSVPNSEQEPDAIPTVQEELDPVLVLEEPSDPDPVPAPVVDVDPIPVPELTPVVDPSLDSDPVISVGLEFEGKIGQIQLVDGESLTELLNIVEGAELDLSELINTFNFTVTLEESESVGSVAVNLTGCASVDRVENFAPYTVGVQGEEFPALQPGSCILSATPYTLPDGQGEAGQAVSVSFSVVSGKDPLVENPVVAPVLADARFYEVLLNWDAPVMRSDGSVLTTNDLASYQIRSSSLSDGEESVFAVRDAEAISYILADLSAGTYEFRIAAIDVDGVSSGFSEALVVSVGN